MITHEIDTIRLRLHNDGALTMTDAQGVQLDLSAEAAFAIAVFYRLPGTRPLLHAALMERRRQQQADEGEPQRPHGRDTGEI